MPAYDYSHHQMRLKDYAFLVLISEYTTTKFTTFQRKLPIQSVGKELSKLIALLMVFAKPGSEDTKRWHLPRNALRKFKVAKPPCWLSSTSFI